jgi:hypothetical protein
MRGKIEMRYKFVIIIIVISLIGYHIYSNWGGSVLSLPDESGLYWRFKTRKEVKLEGRVLPYPPHSSGGMGTVIKGNLQFCTEEAYHILQEEYIEKKKCAKPFWKKHSTYSFLLTDNSEIAQSFKSMKNYDRIRLEGSNLRFLGFYNSDGKRIHSPGAYRQYKFFYVKQIAINDIDI